MTKFNLPVFTYGWNMPGYMPDSDNGSYTTFERAKECLLSSLEQWEESENYDSVVAEVENMESPDYTTGKLDGYIFWINSDIPSDTETQKKRALAEYLDVEDLDDIDQSTYDDCEFSYGGDYLVLTDEESDEKCAEYISESLWAFNASFIIDHADLPFEAEEMIQTFQQEKCEGANETIRAMINDFDAFVSVAISADGRGHFLASYDGDEAEESGFYIYRTN